MPKGPKPRPIVDRFWEKVIVVADGCWRWRGGTNGIGYGIIHVRRRAQDFRQNLYAHRISWETHKGPIPEGLFVLHRCDNPACTNPDHLFLGTNLDNMQDCSAKGRQNGPAKSLPGVLNGNAILNDAIVREIRANSGNGAELGRRLGVSKSLICAIRKRRAWKHVAA